MERQRTKVTSHHSATTSTPTQRRKMIPKKNDPTSTQRQKSDLLIACITEFLFTVMTMMVMCEAGMLQFLSTTACTI